MKTNYHTMYIKGAIADPWLKTKKPPKITSTIKIGINQNFLRALKN